MASDSASDLTLNVVGSDAAARRGEASTTKTTRNGDSSAPGAVAIERAVRALRSTDVGADAARARYDAALTLYRVLAVRANRDAAETADAAAACEEALTRAVAADDDESDDVDERARGVRRETAMCALGALARVRGDGEAAETLRGVGGKMAGAALARWTSLRCVGTSSDDAKRALSASDLVRFAAIISKSADSPASRAFCDCGGVSSLLALIDADDGDSSSASSSMNSAAMFDAAKAVAGFCASNSTRFDVESVSEEIEAILKSSSGTMRDPIPAVAATMLRRAAAALAKRPASRRSSRGALERQASYNISNLTDCVAASDETRATVDAPSELKRSFGSKINLARTRSSSLDSIGGSDVSFNASPSKPAAVPASVPEHHRTSPPLFASSPPPPPLTRKRSSSNVLSTKSPSRSGVGGVATTTRARRHLFRRFTQCLALALVLGVARALSRR